MSMNSHTSLQIHPSLPSIQGLFPSTASWVASTIYFDTKMVRRILLRKHKYKYSEACEACEAVEARNEQIGTKRLLAHKWNYKHSEAREARKAPGNLILDGFRYMLPRLMYYISIRSIPTIMLWKIHVSFTLSLNSRLSKLSKGNSLILSLLLFSRICAWNYRPSVHVYRNKSQRAREPESPSHPGEGQMILWGQ